MRSIVDRARSASLFTTVAIAFAVVLLNSCSGDSPVQVPQTLVGSLRVSVIVGGEEVGTHYSLQVGSSPAFNVSPNSSNLLQNVRAGSHLVRLSGLPSNCTSPTTSIIVQIDPNAQAETEFQITCVPRVGSIVVTTSTSGVFLDTDGYMIIVDDQPAQPVAAEPVTISGVREGNHRVRLTGVAANCLGGTEVTRAVTFATSTNAHFTIVCANAGSVRITVTTTGQAIDANGYRVGISPDPIPSNGIVVVGLVAVGPQVVTLSDIAANCEVVGPVHNNIAVVLNQTTDVQLNVTCATPTMIAFAKYVNNNYEIFTVTSSGQNATQLTNNTRHEFDPVWSRDGRIAFVSDRDGNNEIYVMNADGSNQTRLTTSASPDLDPSWSPDGSKIAFSSSREGKYQIYIMNADGSNVTRMSTSNIDEWEPAWSPDGTKLAFTRMIGFATQVHVMNNNGTGVIRISNTGFSEYGPEWSPDGSKLAFSRWDYYYYYDPQVMLMRSDGVGIATSLGFGDAPSWSPDGKLIVYSINRCEGTWGCTPLTAVNVLSGVRTANIAVGPTTSPSWRW